MTVFLNNRPLLDAFRRGERDALTAVYAAYVEKVTDVLRHGFLFDSGDKTLRFRGISDPLELEAFTQDVFLRAFGERARLGYDGLRPYEPYLLRIAKNLVIDDIRRRRYELEELIGPLDEEQAAAATAERSAEQTIDVERARQLVREFLATRGELEREYVRVRFEEELPLLATARQLGLTRMRARLLERHLLAELARHLRRRGHLQWSDALALFCLGVFA